MSAITPENTFFDHRINGTGRCFYGIKTTTPLGERTEGFDEEYFMGVKTGICSRYEVIQDSNGDNVMVLRSMDQYQDGNHVRSFF